MLFPTMTFALFFVVVLGVSWRLSDRPLQWKLFVLAASYVFYGWADWMFVLLLAGSTVGNWTVALAVHRATTDRSRKVAVLAGVGLNLILLGFFKYYGFFVDSVLSALAPLGLAPTPLLIKVLLPVGISFFTFCAISYVVDVFRGEQEPISFLDFAVYLSFFPHLVAGPIVRVSEFEPQLRRRRNPESIDATACRPTDLSGPVQEGGDRQLPGHGDRGSGVRRSGAPHELGTALRCMGLRRADLRRLLGLHRHRHRHRAADGHQVPGQLRPAVLGPVDPGVLASLAHDALDGGCATICTSRWVATEADHVRSTATSS